MRLIDADKFIEYLGLDEESAREENLGEIVTLEDFDRQETAFDLESVIKQLEGKRDYYYKKMKNTDGCCVGMFNEYHSKGIAFNEALEILKSAANAANGKNGG